MSDLVDEVLPRLAAEWRVDAEAVGGQFGTALTRCAEDVERLLRAGAVLGSQRLEPTE